jgi:hypothetical protein
MTEYITKEQAEKIVIDTGLFPTSLERKSYCELLREPST